jgi:CheY-like chemotaxis protein
MAYAHTRFVIWRTIEWQIRTQWTTRLHTILLVDDESELRDVLVTILAEPGHTVLMASDGYEALRILVERRVDLLITDVKMPGISGFELARQAKLMRPDLHILYISGSQAAVRHTQGPTYGRVLDKPLRASDLLVEVSRALGPASSGSNSRHS